MKRLAIPSPVPKPKELPKLSSASDARLRRSIENRRMSQSMIQIPGQMTVVVDDMFDQFFLVGVPPDYEGDPKAEVLVMYPSTQFPEKESDLQKIVSFCFPGGVTRNARQSKLLDSMFTFLSSENDRRIYGVCVHARLPDDASPFFMSELNREFPFCFCLLSKHPFFSSHLEFLAIMILVLCDKLKCGLKEKERQITSARVWCLPPLVINHRFPCMAVWPEMQLPGILFAMLSHYSSMPASRQDVPHVDDLLCDESPVFVPLHITKHQCLAYTTLDFLFSVLSVESVMQLYTAQLLERSILFYSKDPHKYSSAVLALTCLIAPFNSSATVIPVVPDQEEYLALLDSPVPFIAGTSAKTATADVYVDLDEGTIQFADKLEMLPTAHDLTKQIKNVLALHQNDITVPPPQKKLLFGRKEKNPEYEAFINSSSNFGLPHEYLLDHPQKYLFSALCADSIQSIFSSHLCNFLSEKIKPCFVTDTTDSANPISVLNQELFLSQFDGPEHEFYTQFSGTNIFNELTNRHAQEVEATKNRPLEPHPMRLIKSASDYNLHDTLRYAH